MYKWTLRKDGALVMVNEDGIEQFVYDQPIFITIKDLCVLPWNEYYRNHHPQVVL
jgi:splicing factor 3B subunit 3